MLGAKRPPGLPSDIARARGRIPGSASGGCRRAPKSDKPPSKRPAPTGLPFNVRWTAPFQAAILPICVPGSMAAAKWRSSDQARGRRTHGSG
jgi:hypothetical protein